MDYYDFLLILNCTLLTLWMTLFIKTWIQKEKIYNYIWGTEKFSHSEPDREDFIPDDNIKIMFYHNFPYINPIKKKNKNNNIIFSIIFHVINNNVLCILYIFYKTNSYSKISKIFYIYWFFNINVK
jgi:hypothetical protein